MDTRADQVNYWQFKPAFWVLPLEKGEQKTNENSVQWNLGHCSRVNMSQMCGVDKIAQIWWARKRQHAEENRKIIENFGLRINFKKIWFNFNYLVPSSASYSSSVTAADLQPLEIDTVPIISKTMYYIWLMNYGNVRITVSIYRGGFVESCDT